MRYELSEGPRDPFLTAYYGIAGYAQCVATEAMRLAAKASESPITAFSRYIASDVEIDGVRPLSATSAKR
jgi:hypothetical protein